MTADTDAEPTPVADAQTRAPAACLATVDRATRTNRELGRPFTRRTDGRLESRMARQRGEPRLDGIVPDPERVSERVDP